VVLKLLWSVHLSTQNPLHHIGFGVVLLHMLTPKDHGIVIVKVTYIVSLKCKIIFNITSTYITSVIYGNVGFLAGTIALEGPTLWQRWHLISEVRPVDVVDDEDSFAATWGVGGVISEARGVGGGVIDVEGVHEVEGVIEKWVVAGAREVEGGIHVWRGVNELFNLVGCRPCNSFSANIASWNKWLTVLYSL
jgi:hypothetical protein